MPDIARVQVLVEAAFDVFDDPSVSTAAILRRCIRIATLRNDFSNLLWLELEAQINGETREEKQRRRTELASHFTKDEWAEIHPAYFDAYIKRRTLDSNKERIWGLSIQVAENSLATVEHQLALLAVPPGLSPMDVRTRSQAIDRARAELLTQVMDLRNVVSRTRERLFRFLVETERALEFGQINADIFERNRKYVDEKLTKLSPEALEQFVSAYRRVADGDQESRSQAMTSCRRVLKTVADAVYPARSEPVRCADGKVRDLNDARYLNRLTQFVAESVGKHGVGQVVQSVVQDLGARLHAVDEMASKGVHATVSEHEVDSCVIQTYLVIGDVLRIEDDIVALSTVVDDPAGVAATV